jgi:hypothetical protein
VGQVGFWLPWDPCADKIDNEEYLETELNTLMKEYKENEIRRDLFYEDQKRENKQDAMRKKMLHDKAQKKSQVTNSISEPGTSTLSETGEQLENDDPWMASKFTEAQNTTDNIQPTDTTTDNTTDVLVV